VKAPIRLARVSPSWAIILFVFAPGRFMDDYDDSFWGFDFDGDGDIDANDDLWGDLLFLANMEEMDREPRPPRPSGSATPSCGGH